MRDASLVFDLDGTLADTAGDLIATANQLLAQRRLPALDFAATRNAAGMGGRVLMRLGYERAGVPVDAAGIEASYPEFLAIYATRLADRTELFAGVAATLQELLAEGCRLGVCTNKPVAQAAELLRRIGIADLFGAVLGGDSLAVCKPDPRHVLETVARMGGDPRRAVMIGDSRVDFEAARAAAVPCILMRYGYSPEPVDLMGAAAVADRFGALPGLFRQLLAGVAPQGR